MQRRLEVNYDFIDADFQSYRLNRDVKHSLTSVDFPDGNKLHHFKLNDSDYSYCHASMSSNINNLYQDRFNPDQVYFISTSGGIYGAYLTTEGSEHFELKNVFSISDFDTDSMYASLSFPSREAVLLLLSTKYPSKFTIKQSEEAIHLEKADYSTKLIIFSRNYKDNLEDWTIESSLDVSRIALYSSLNVIGSSHMHLFDSLKVDNVTQNIIIGSVNECFQIDSNTKTSDNQKLKSRFGAIFHRVKLHRDAQNNWTIVENCRFIEDAQAANDFPKYVALGNDEDILIVSKLRMRYSKVSEISFISPGNIENENIILLSQELKDDQTVDDELIQEVEREETEAIKRAKFTKAVFDEYENCDMQNNLSSLVLTQFDCKSGEVLNEFDISTQQWLFSLSNLSNDSFPFRRFPFIVMRHDVDAFIYEPRTIMSNDEKKLEMKHVDSFPAFGYISASKQHRRFMTFSQEISQEETNFNYAVIDNWIDQMLYVYGKCSLDESSQQAVIKPHTGQQYLFHFGENTISSSSRPMIYGLCALPCFTIPSGHLSKQHWKGAIYVLTEEKLHLIQF